MISGMREGGQWDEERAISGMRKEDQWDEGRRVRGMREGGSVG